MFEYYVMIEQEDDDCIGIGYENYNEAIQKSQELTRETGKKCFVYKTVAITRTALLIDTQEFTQDEIEEVEVV